MVIGVLLEDAVHVEAACHTVPLFVVLEFLVVCFELAHVVLGGLGSFQ